MSYKLANTKEVLLTLLGFYACFLLLILSANVPWDITLIGGLAVSVIPLALVIIKVGTYAQITGDMLTLVVGFGIRTSIPIRNIGHIYSTTAFKVGSYNVYMIDYRDRQGDIKHITATGIYTDKQVAEVLIRDLVQINPKILVTDSKGVTRISG